MPFYFRVPLPGPFGYSHRIGGRKRRRTPTRKPAATRTPAPPQRGATYQATFGDWSCSHSHSTVRESNLCALQRKLDEVDRIEDELKTVNATDAESRQKYAETQAEIAKMRAETLQEMRSLS